MNNNKKENLHFHGILNLNYFGTKNKTPQQRVRCYLTSNNFNRRLFTNKP